MKNGFRILDSDIHVIEPGDLFENYLEDPFRSNIPRTERSELTGFDTWLIPGNRVFPPWIKWPEFIAANDTLFATKSATPEQVAAFETGFDAKTTLAAMDLEGVDAAALLRTLGGMWVIGTDGLEPEYAAALCRAYNNWLHDYCAEDPARLKGVAILPLQAIDLAIEEARRVVNDLGFVGVTVHCEPVDGRLLYGAWASPHACTGLRPPLASRM
jgi:predicted TIM-barrel fold metal-dependent hydrolase